MVIVRFRGGDGGAGFSSRHQPSVERESSGVYAQGINPRSCAVPDNWVPLSREDTEGCVSLASLPITLSPSPTSCMVPDDHKLILAKSIVLEIRTRPSFVPRWSWEHFRGILI